MKNNVIVLNEEQFQDAIYRAVSRCLDERQVDMLSGSSKNEEGYYSRDELCSLLHIAYPTLWRIEKSGMLVSQKVGRRNLYPKQLVDQLVKSGKLAKYNR